MHTSFLTAAMLAFAITLGSGAASAQVQFGDPQEPEKATAILNLNVPGFGTFDVVFDQQAFASEIYGPFPGDLVDLPPWFGVEGVEAAAMAVNAALNALDVLEVGEVGLAGVEVYNIGAYTFICCKLPIVDDPSIPSIAVARSTNEGFDWFAAENFISYGLDERDWAVFTVSGTICGNGVVQVGEECDDGNTTSGDGCSATCMVETQAVCGNAAVEAGEECDDGNTTSGDGCSAVCMVEAQPVCGNAVIEGNEQCDDGNTVSGDGCSATCTVEAGQDTMVQFGDPQELEKATGILNLEVPGFGTFNVTFDQGELASEIYGPFPGDLSNLPPWNGVAGTEAAAKAVNALLNVEDVLEVGEVGVAGVEVYNIGSYTFICCSLPLFDDPMIPSIGVARSTNEGLDWFAGENFLPYAAELATWAVFTPVPEPGAALALVAALATLGMVGRRRRREGRERTT